MKIIDSHVHFWDPEKLSYDWLGEVPAIQNRFLPEDYRKATDKINVDGLVFVEAACSPQQNLAEVSWIETLVELEPRIQGIVASAPMEKGKDMTGHLEALVRRPLVKGIRRLIQSEAQGFCTQSKFIDAVRLLPNYNFSFDLCIKHHQFPDVLELVSACPGTSFILDHIGKPDIANALAVPWQEHILELSSAPNVIGCKLSGLITEAHWDSWSVDDLRPYLEHVITCFGPDRVLYGSDWPVSTLAGGYQRWWQAFSSIFDSLNPEDLEKITFGNAKRIYKLL
jgi:L-fuconolactonase